MAGGTTADWSGVGIASHGCFERLDALSAGELSSGCASGPSHAVCSVVCSGRAVCAKAGMYHTASQAVAAVPVSFEVRVAMRACRAQSKTDTGCQATILVDVIVNARQCSPRASCDECLEPLTAYSVGFIRHRHDDVSNANSATRDAWPSKLEDASDAHHARSRLGRSSVCRRRHSPRTARANSCSRGEAGTPRLMLLHSKLDRVYKDRLSDAISHELCSEVRRHLLAGCPRPFARITACRSRHPRRSLG